MKPPTGPMRKPADAMRDQLAQIDANTQQMVEHCNSNVPLDAAGLAAITQVYAICALVHAVRALTDEVQALREQGAG